MFREKMMCGRFALSESPSILAKALGLEPPAAGPRYNIAPSQPVAAVLTAPETPGPAFHSPIWGLVPFWARDRAFASRLINARVETAHEKPAFRAAFRHRRCLIPATGFYEWRREGRSKAPFYFSPSEEGAALVLAGLWEDWTDGQEHVRSLAILTTGANGIMRPVHDRMPVVLPREAWDRWVDPAVQNPRDIEEWLVPCGDSLLTARRIGPFVNNVRHEGPECLSPATGFN